MLSGGVRDVEWLTEGTKDLRDEYHGGYTCIKCKKREITLKTTTLLSTSDAFRLAFPIRGNKVHYTFYRVSHFTTLVRHSQPIHLRSSGNPSKTTNHKPAHHPAHGSKRTVVPA